MVMSVDCAAVELLLSGVPGGLQVQHTRTHTGGGEERLHSAVIETLGLLVQVASECRTETRKVRKQGRETVFRSTRKWTDDQ